MEWKDAAFALGGFLAGLVASLLKAVMPPYAELVKENAVLRKENQDLIETNRGLEDALRDHEETENARPDRPR